MDRLFSALIVLGVLALALGLMWWGWRRRQRAQAGLPTLGGVPADAGDVLFSTDAFYVATTESDRPLERIAVGGLGYRARASLAARERGVELAIPGQDRLFIPVATIDAVFRARHTIDRVVEQDGLVVVRFRLSTEGDPGSTAAVDCYLRVVDPTMAARLIDELEALLARGVSQ